LYPYVQFVAAKPRNFEELYNYLRKEYTGSESFKTNFNLFLNKNGVAISPREFFEELMFEHGYEKAFSIMKEKDRTFLIENHQKYSSYNNADKNVNKILEMKEFEEMENEEEEIDNLFDFPFPKNDPFAVENYKILKHILEKGFGYQSIIICGKSRTGKSSLAKALADLIITILKELYPDQEFSVLFLSEYQNLKDYDEKKHKVIIFDDVSFSHLSKQSRSATMNHLLGSFDYCSQLRVLYNTVTIAPFTVRLFTINDIRDILPIPRMNLLQRTAILYIRDEFELRDVETGKPLPHNDTLNFYINPKDVDIYPLNLEFVDNFDEIKTKAFKNITNRNNMKIHQNIKNVKNLTNVTNNITNSLNLNIKLSENKEVNREFLQNLHNHFTNKYFSKLFDSEKELKDYYEKVVGYTIEDGMMYESEL
jgi:hypothetical protein